MKTMNDILKFSTMKEFKHFIYCFRGELTIQFRKAYYKGNLIAIYRPEKDINNIITNAIHNLKNKQND